MNLTLRTFHTDDYPSIRALWIDTGLELTPSDDLPELLITLKRDPQLFVVALLETKIVGAVLGRFDGRRGLIYHLAVHPNYQGRRIGAALMEEVTSRLLILGCPKINLHVAPHNKGVMNFYSKLGFAYSELHYMSKWINTQL